MDPADVGYRGLWRRRLLRDADGEDRDTQVWWLQGDSYYVDLRIPPGRPDFSGVTGFDQCSDQQLAWLASQQGFAGRLQVDGNRLHWQRTIDFQPRAALADIGTVHWDDECLYEQGVLADYAEEWLWQRPDNASTHVWTTPDGHGLRLVVGNWFMQVLELRRSLPPCTSLAELITRPGTSPAALFNCAIDFGRVGDSENNWQVQHSSLPWRECNNLVDLNAQYVYWQGLMRPDVG